MVRRIEYNQLRLVWQAAGGTFLALLAFWAWQASGNWIAALGMPLFGLVALLSGRAMLQNMPAIAFDTTALELNSLWGRTVVPWRAVQDIRVEVLTMRMYGFIPVNRTYTLVVAFDGGLFGSRRVRFPAKLLDVPGGPPVALTILQQARIAAVGEVGVAMKGAHATGWGAMPDPVPTPAPQTLGFDPDEAIARYLASKHDEAATAPDPNPPVSRPTVVPIHPQAAAPVPAAPLQAAPPQRPVFGRRTA